MKQNYRVNTQDIMHETIDGEVVIVNLDTGAYYAFDGSGEYIWERLSTDGSNAQQLVSELQARFAATEQEIASGVEKFLAQLLDEALIVPADTAAPSSTNSPTQIAGEFVAPQLNKYTDMEALLLADPIHEVEPDGWPSVKS
ncbi:MAG: PqqD family protein [Halioglobus sp.]